MKLKAQLGRRALMTHKSQLLEPRLLNEHPSRLASQNEANMNRIAHEKEIKRKQKHLFPLHSTISRTEGTTFLTANIF